MLPTPYYYYFNRIIPFFFLAIFNYKNLHYVPKLYRLQYEVNVFYGNSNFSFIKNLALLVFNSMCLPSTMGRNRRVPVYQWRYIFALSVKNLESYGFYLKFLTTSIARLKKAPFKNELQPNQQYSFTIPNYTTIESHYFQLNLYEQIFSGFNVLRFQFNKTKFNLGIEYQNVLRMLNFPILRKLSF